MNSFRPTLAPIAGYVEIEYNNERVYKRLSDNRLFYADLTPIIPYTQAEKRKKSYETLPLISFNEEFLTVDEAERKFYQYYPDTSKQAVAAELREKISAAKDYIRRLYPDENTEPLMEET